MDAFTVIGSILTLFGRVPSLGERKRMLRGKIEYLRARIDDVKGNEIAYSSSFQVQRGKKRKRGSDLSVWVTDGKMLLKVAEDLLTQLDKRRSFLRSVDGLVEALVLHEGKGEIFCRHSSSNGRGPRRGSCIPVKELIGRVRLNTLDELEHLLLDGEVGRVAILGREGIGKTFLMKHLHNSVLKQVQRFDYVFWVSFPDDFSIRRVQDAVAAAVKFDFSSNNDLNVRARELSKKLLDLGSFVLFIDGLPKQFALDQIGIPVPVKGSASKLVVTTSSTALGCRMLDGFETVELDRLSEKEAMQLFMREANIDMSSVSLLSNIPWLLTMLCDGIPRRIVETASHKCGIDDIHEWNNTLFELGNHEK